MKNERDALININGSFSFSLPFLEEKFTVYSLLQGNMEL